MKRLKFTEAQIAFALKQSETNTGEKVDPVLAFLSILGHTSVIGLRRNRIRAAQWR